MTDGHLPLPASSSAASPRKILPTGFNGKITPGNHHAHGIPPHPGEENVGKPFESLQRLDLENDAKFGGLQVIEGGTQVLDI